jgi:RHH-type proline utilization regulon transcriptional repressor/proline dehydrogenase/delta 1-pyrroline-5-carboxylate dehydrogenase
LPAEESVARHAGRVLDAARAHKGGWAVTDALTKQATGDPLLKTQLFRLIDVLPRLRSDASVARHAREYLVDEARLGASGAHSALQRAVEVGTSGVAGALGGHAAVKAAVVAPVEAMGARFIAGRDAAEAAPALAELWRAGVGFSSDLLGEAVVRREEAEAYHSQYQALIEQLPALAATWEPNPTLEADHLGAVPRANVSVKISALLETLHPVATEKCVAELKARLRPLLLAAEQHGVHINFDMEEYKYKDLTFRLFRELCEEISFSAGYSHQAYLRCTEADAQDQADWARANCRVVQARLVKGAYHDHETIHAEERNWPAPVWRRKVDSDAAWERTAWRLISQYPREPGQGGVKLALGTHNARSLGFALAALEEVGLPESAVEVQNLRGMAGGIRDGCVSLGLRVREYVPFGEVVPGMSYLVRRLLENTSNQSWLLSADGANAADSDGKLLASPHGVSPDDGGPAADQPRWHGLSGAIEGLGDSRPFFTAPLTDFSKRAAREELAGAIERRAAVAASLLPPADASAEDAVAAVERAKAAAAAWEAVPAAERAAVLTRAAEDMRGRRAELAALIINENGKGWSDADAEVAEAIDFLEYYAREAVRLFEPRQLGRFLGEENVLAHRPRGVAAIIAPWNFPFAILCGMSSAALVTGNPVVMKPAEQTPETAKAVHSILLAAGAPPDCLQLLHGRGEVVGEALVAHADIPTVVFTGSREVGAHIVERAAKLAPGQSEFKRVIAEMGGKNALIVDESADMDEAVVGVVASAFAFQGQKCSAASRIVVHEAVYDEFLERVTGAARDLVVGDPRDPATDVGPMVDADAQAKSEAHIAAATAAAEACGHDESQPQGARLVFAGAAPSAGASLMPGRRYVAPHIFAVNGDAPVELWRDEVFGPVLAVAKARDFDHALQLANSSPYRLTGGLYSRTPSHIERAGREFRVGNLYINRGITGAEVGRQPFGGGGMSGAGTDKAGGPAYLEAFVEPYVVCSNQQRRGFAPGMLQTS